MSTVDSVIDARRQKRKAHLERRTAEHPAIGRIIGTELRDLRRLVGLSQEEAAVLAGFDRTYPSMLERGARYPTLPVFIRYVRVLKADPDKVLARIEKALKAGGFLRG